MLQPTLVALFVSIQCTARQSYDADLQISLSFIFKRAGGSSATIPLPPSLSQQSIP